MPIENNVFNIYFIQIVHSKLLIIQHLHMTICNIMKTVVCILQCGFKIVIIELQNYNISIYTDILEF